MWPAFDPRRFNQPAVDGVGRREMRGFQFPAGRLPSQVDLRPHMTPVEDQEDMSTCAANAFAGACEYIYKRRTGRHIDVSRLFIYYNGQMIDQRSRDVTDDGASKQNTILGMRKFGVCEEALWPYNPDLLNKEPPPHVYKAASRITVVPLKIPRNLPAMKTCLANQVPFLIGIKLLDSATKEAKDNNGYITMPDPANSEVAKTNTHAVLIVGYNDRTGHFLVRNSWGNDWGVNGYFFIPYGYLMENRLINWADGLWAISAILPRSDHKPTVRRLLVPGHNLDEQRQRHQTRAPAQHHHQTMGTLPFFNRHPPMHHSSMPLFPGMGANVHHRHR